MGFKDVYQCKSYTCLIVLFAARLSDFLIYVDKKMAQKNFFADLDPLSRLRNFEPQTRVMPQLYREDRGRMDDSYVETFQTKETGISNGERICICIHLMLQLKEGTMEEMRERLQS